MAAKKTSSTTGPDSTESLTIFLAKEGLTKPADLFKSTSGLKSYSIKDADGELGTLFVQPRTSHAPRWAEFFAGQVNTKEFGGVSSAAAVL